MNRVLFVVGNDVFLNKKGFNQNVKIRNPGSFSIEDSCEIAYSIHSFVIENILSIYRICFDLKEPTDNISIGTCFGDSASTLSMIHSWKKEEQSLTYILQRFAKRNLNILKKIQLCEKKDWDSYDAILATPRGKDMIARPKFESSVGDMDDDYHLESSDEEYQADDDYLGFLELGIKEKKIDLEPEKGGKKVITPPPPTTKNTASSSEELKNTQQIEKESSIFIPPPPPLLKETRKHPPSELNKIWFVDFFSKILKRLYQGKPQNRSISNAKMVYFTTEDRITTVMVHDFFCKKGYRKVVVNKGLCFELDIFILMNHPPPPASKPGKLLGVVEETIELPREFSSYPSECRVRKFYIFPFNTLSDCLLNEICLKLGYVQVVMKDIPFSPKSSDRDVHYNSTYCKIPFVCRSDRIDLTLSLPQFENESSTPVMLYYLPTNSMKIHNELTTRSMHGISPRYINSFTKEFIQYFLDQKVSMIFTTSSLRENNNNNGSSSSSSYPSTHFLQSHHGRMYIHTVLPSSHFTFSPLLVPSPLTEAHPPHFYRTEEMRRMMDQYNHTSKSRKKEERIHKTVSLLPSSSNNKKNELLHRQTYETYKYFQDVTPERNPLNHQTHSVLFRGDGAFATLLTHIEPLLDLIKRRKVTANTKTQSRKILRHLKQELAENKSEYYFPEYPNNHTLRYHAYQRIWFELRELAVQYEKQEYAKIMNDIHPSFFFITDQKRRELEKIKRFIYIERDGLGLPVLPIRIGSAVQIECLGQVVADRGDAFYTDKYIWPIGFRSTRLYFDINNVEERVKYICEIKDGGNAPLFQISTGRKDDPVIVERSCTAVWTVIVKQVNAMKTNKKQQRVFTNVSGPEYFGLSHPQVIQLISELPNADKIHRANCPFQPAKIQSHYFHHHQRQFVGQQQQQTLLATTEPSMFYNGEGTRGTNGTIPTTVDKNEGNKNLQKLPLPQRLRVERDMRVEKERLEVLERKKGVNWVKNNSLHKFFKNRAGKLGGAREFYGREEGCVGLYSEKPIVLKGTEQEECYFDENGVLRWRRKGRKKKRAKKKRSRGEMEEDDFGNGEDLEGVKKKRKLD